MFCEGLHRHCLGSIALDNTKVSQVVTAYPNRSRQKLDADLNKICRPSAKFRKPKDAMKFIK